VDVTRHAAIAGLDPQHYERHVLHAEDRVWVEKNCYVDIWIELVHALGCEPMAMMPFVLCMDFEGDQWTFFKPKHEELFDLYGIDVQELNPWLTLIEHARRYLAQGKLISTEADAHWLPDTAGTDYQRSHTKTTIIINDIDVEAERLGYFHNAGYHMLEGRDFRRTFRVGVPEDPTFLPLYAEAVRVDRLVRRPDAELKRMSRRLLARHLERVPVENPFERFGAAFDGELVWVQERGLDFYHQWAFATLRQVGAAFEAGALYLRWLDADREAAAEAFASIGESAKVMLMKAARAVNRKRPLDASEDFATIASAWARGMDLLADAAAR
jgi:Domain of unknown function (DUF1839)